MASTDQSGVYEGVVPPSIAYGKCFLDVGYLSFDTSDDADEYPEERSPKLAKLFLKPNVSGAVVGPNLKIYSIDQTVLYSNDGHFEFWAIDGNHSSLSVQGWNWTAQLTADGKSLATFTFSPDSSSEFPRNIGQDFPIGKAVDTGAVVTTGPPPAVEWDGDQLLVTGSNGSYLGPHLTGPGNSNADVSTYVSNVGPTQTALDARYSKPEDADSSISELISSADTQTQSALNTQVDAHLGGDSTNLVAKQPTAVVSRTNLAAGADATAIIQAALDALDATQGGTVTLPTVAFQVRIDGTLRIDPGKCLDIPPGVELARLSAYSSSTAPVVNLAGNHAALIGKGLVSSQNASPNGVVMFGPPTVTLADFGASMTAGSPNLTVSGARDTFTAGDVGKSVSVAGAGASGGWCTGTITSVTDSTHAVLSANAATTISATQAYWGQQLPVCWAKADVRVTGNSGATSEGFSLYSSPQGQTGLTVGCKIRGQVQNVKTGVGFHLQANGNVATELQWYRITGDAVLFDDAVEDNVTGGFVHSSPGLAYIVHGQRAVYCVTRGVQGEPGAGAAYTLDANSTKNSIDVNANAPGSSTDNGTNNHIQQGTYTRGQRIEARDGLTLPIKTGGYADGDFARTPTTGLLALDSSASPAYSRLQARVGATWKSSALYTRLLQASTIKDPPSIAAGATWDTPITVTGALLGDSAKAAPSGMLPAGIVWLAAVSAADTVTLRLANVTAGAIDPPSMTWYVEVAGK